MFNVDKKGRTVLYGGVPRSLKRFLSTVSRFELLGICGTLRIVIPVENHPQKPKNRLADYIFCCACVLFLRSLLLYTLNLYPYTLPHLSKTDSLRYSLAIQPRLIFIPSYSSRTIPNRSVFVVSDNT